MFIQRIILLQCCTN